MTDGGVRKRPLTIAETFDECCPQYLAMGMTYEQFWEQDCSLVIPYRKAYRIKMEQQNRFAWLQGMYIYEALCDVSPVLHAFAKSGTTVRPYPDKPYEFETAKKKTEAEKNEQKKQNAIAYMEQMTARFNQSFKRRQPKPTETGTPGTQNSNAKEVTSDVRSNDASNPNQG